MTTTTEKPMSRSYLSLLPPRLHAAPMAEEFAATLADWVGESQNGAPAYQREAIPPRSRWTEVASDVGREQREKATGVAHCYRVLDSAGAVIAACSNYAVADSIADEFSGIAQVRPTPIPHVLGTLNKK